MTNQEAINVLEKYADVPKSETVRAAYQMALSALQKQIPKKPIKIEETYNAERGEWIADYECPSCGNPYADDSFCSCCGQALDWSDNK